MNNSYIEVNMQALLDNARAILRGIGEQTKLIPVLKDDAYGLGLVPVAKQLCTLPEISAVAVSHVSEGLELRAAGIDREILVMASALPFQLEAAVSAGLTLACGRLGLVSELADAAKALGRKAHIHIKIDTGLHRIGIEPEELDSFIAELKANAEHVLVDGAFSHFSDSSNPELSRGEYGVFCAAADKLEAAGIRIPLRHMASSATSETHPEYNMDAVRIGRRLYMDNPSTPLGNITELASWRGYITNIKLRRAGDTVGYGEGVRLEHDSVIATVGIGYGDGLNQELVKIKAPLLVKGKAAHYLACCMDQCMIDVTGIECKVGDEVTFFGYDGKGGYLSSQEIAAMINGDEGCGLTSALSKRVARVYKY
ncbi:MAG: alanine racemase [Oscillospiraceae bacterium]|nr:alanine racemase [Oscillospiraceae bacterium]